MVFERVVNFERLRGENIAEHVGLVNSERLRCGTFGSSILEIHYSFIGFALTAVGGLSAEESEAGPAFPTGASFLI